MLRLLSSLKGKRWMSCKRKWQKVKAVKNCENSPNHQLSFSLETFSITLCFELEGQRSGKCHARATKKSIESGKNCVFGGLWLQNLSNWHCLIISGLLLKPSLSSFACLWSYSVIWSGPQEYRRFPKREDDFEALTVLIPSIGKEKGPLKLLVLSKTLSFSCTFRVYMRCSRVYLCEGALWRY